MTEFKYIKNAIANGEGTILIYKEIGNSVDKFGNIHYGINGADFGAEMQYLQNYCKNITVRINSIGGSVIDGYSIASAIYNSSIPVTTIIDGMAASTALWCAAAGSTRKAMDYSTGMTHKSSGSEDKSVLNLIDETINTMLSNRSNLNSDEIKNMMETETWLGAKDLLKNGFIDEIIDTKKKVKVTKNIAEMALIYNKLINPVNMSKINPLLKLSNNADENDQVGAIEKLNNTLAETEAKLTEANAKLAAFEKEKADKEAAEQTALKNKSEKLANELVNKGVIKQDEVAATVEALVNNFDFTAGLLNKMIPGKESKKPFDVNNIKNAGEDRSSWSYKDWESKDEEGLKDMYVNNRAQFNELVKTIKTKK